MLQNENNQNANEKKLKRGTLKCLNPLCDSTKGTWRKDTGQAGGGKCWCSSCLKAE